MLSRFSLFFLLFLLLNACHKPGLIQSIQVKQTSVDSSQKTDTKINTFLQPYKSRIDNEMNEVLITLGQELNKQQPNGSLNYFVSDVMLETGRKLSKDSIHACLINYGGIRLPSLPSGIITKGKIFELLPFDNQMTIVNVSGDILLKFLNHTAKKGGWPMSGIKYTLADTLATLITINNDSIDFTQKYNVLVPDYVAQGGDQCDFLVSQPQKSLGILMRDAMIEFLKEKSKQDSIYVHPGFNRIIKLKKQ